MKKTVSIQISGMLFHVDDDAYARLDAYLQSIRTHFAHLADRDEIVSDIESRIAETFSEKIKKSKQTVTLKDVEALIAKMGTVEDFEAFEADTEKESEKAADDDLPEKKVPRRFYRNPDDKVIAGVCSGIASYFNIDPVFVRVIFAVFGLMHGIGVVAYIILWIAMPLAKTHSERMEMQGQPMTLSGLQKKIQRSTHTFATENFHSIYARGGIRLFIREGKECSVAVRGSPQELLHTDIHVINGQLRIEPLRGWWWGFYNGFRRLSFDITLPQLSAVDVAGGCSVDVNGFSEKELSLRAVGASVLRADVRATTLRVHIEGASSGTIGGTGERIDMTVIGASSANARSFVAKTGHVDLSGASAGHLSATDTVDGSVSGACSLCVYGNPTVTAKASGGSSIKNKDASAPVTEEWQQKETYDDQKNYTYSSPLSRLIQGIGKFIWLILSLILRFIGGMMTAVGGILLVLLIIAAIQTFKTGFIPFLHMGPVVLNGPLDFLYVLIGAFLIIVPLGLLMTFGSSLIHLRKQFDTAGIVTLFAFWVVAVVVTGFVGGMAIRNMEQANRGPAAEQVYGAKDFDSVQAEDSDALIIQQGSGFSVTARGPKEAIDRIHLRMQKNTLVIEHTKRTDFCLGCDVHAVTFTITMPRIAALTTGGLTNATVSGVSGATLTLTAKDLSHVRLSGKTDLFTFVSTDLSHVDALELEAMNVSATTSDLSHAEVTALQVIKGDTHDLSKLFYRGTASSDVRSTDLSNFSSESYYDERYLPSPDAPGEF